MILFRPHISIIYQLPNSSQTNLYYVLKVELCDLLSERSQAQDNKDCLITLVEFKEGDVTELKVDWWLSEALNLFLLSTKFIQYYLYMDIYWTMCCSICSFYIAASLKKSYCPSSISHQLSIPSQAAVEDINNLSTIQGGLLASMILFKFCYMQLQML